MKPKLIPLKDVAPEYIQMIMKNATHLYNDARKGILEEPLVNLEVVIEFCSTALTFDTTAREPAELKRNAINAIRDLGRSYRLSGRFEDAIAAYDRAIFHDPDTIDSYMGSGAALLCTGRFEEAIHDFKSVLGMTCPFCPPNESLSESRGIAHEMLGYAYARLGNGVLSQHHYSKSLDNLRLPMRDHRQ